jgi:hypothetical protein
VPHSRQRAHTGQTVGITVASDHAMLALTLRAEVIEAAR